jgi:hypothetical protein
VVIYDTVEELIENVDAELILTHFNKSNVIAAQAKERQAHAPASIGKGKKFEMCMNLLTPDEMFSCAGNYAALEDLANTKLPEVEATLAAQAGEAGGTVEEVAVTE